MVTWDCDHCKNKTQADKYNVSKIYFTAGSLNQNLEVVKPVCYRGSHSKDVKYCLAKVPVGQYLDIKTFSVFIVIWPTRAFTCAEYLNEWN